MNTFVFTGEENEEKLAPGDTLVIIVATHNFLGVTTEQENRQVINKVPNKKRSKHEVDLYEYNYKHHNKR